MANMGAYVMPAPGGPQRKDEVLIDVEDVALPYHAWPFSHRGGYARAGGGRSTSGVRWCERLLIVVELTRSVLE
jgi:hypothetical protein